ncbi:MAG: indole-3-glycerol phosphate synthase TrpC [Actinomycetia bacterium]|nr:indole-3-glycerol phosphate synthase TrpC [Actinomycetes bacterium]
MNILDRIVVSTRERVQRDKAAGQLAMPPTRPGGTRLGGGRPAFLFEQALKAPGISLICEVKKASPSKGLIAGDFPYLEIAADYEQAGAAAISVLTEPEFFQGSDRYLAEIAQQVTLPLLRKDFVVDAFQIEQAACLGADAVLLIAAILEPAELAAFIRAADSFGLSCLVEVHDADELRAALGAGARVIGVNNRDLKTFTVDVENSIRLRHLAPPDVAFVSESGIRTAADVGRLRDNGVDAVLIGEALMLAADKQAALAELRGAAGEPGHRREMRTVRHCGPDPQSFAPARVELEGRGL